MNDHLSTDERPPHERASAGQRHYIAPPGVSHAGGTALPRGIQSPRAEQPTIPDTSMRHVGAVPQTMPPPPAVASTQLATARAAVAALRSNPRDADALEVLHRVLHASAVSVSADGSVSPAAWNALNWLAQANGVLVAAHKDAAAYLTP